ncbi:glycoside hydrolase family 32 protein [Cohnella sp.]|uniref:glycoside hydrolase family 32 protein n=1 Tax=Cohnella sp. TaxID=1883426 RepID=UPI00356A1F48
MTYETVGLNAHRAAIARAERSVELAVREGIHDPLRPQIHFTARANWINDPNGLIHFNDEYHLFYQYYPYGNRWGSMHWGHAKSKDLVNWEHLPIALAPSEEYDLHERGGCYSGSAVDDNGVLSLLYTGTVIRDGVLCQTQCLATSQDGITFEKYAGNPVITVPPEEGSSDFRDPKVWKVEGVWYMVLGSGRDGIGKALLYRSPDLRKWDYVGVMAESDGTLGYMWECPDFFPVGDKYVLMLSPMGMGDKKTIYLVGDMDYITGKFTWDKMGDTDIGFDFYGPQSFLDASGRRIIIAWLNSWDWMPWFNDYSPPSVTEWCGSMSIPRVVELNAQGLLSFKPVEEMKTLRNRHYQTDGPFCVKPGEPEALPDFAGMPLEMIISFRLRDTAATRFGLVLKGSEDGARQTVIEYNPESKQLCIDRSQSDGWSKGVCSVHLHSSDGEQLTLHLFVDSSNIELLTENYTTAMTLNMYPNPDDRCMHVYTADDSIEVESLEIWELSREING